MTKQEKAALVSVATNSVLTLVKFILASVTASVALLAEAYHSLADIFSSLLVLMALRADRPDTSAVPDASPSLDKHPPVPEKGRKLFASGNWEHKVAMGIGILLILAALNVLTTAGQSSPIDLRYPVIAAIAISLLALCSYLLYRFETSVGEATDSPALIADGRHAQADMLASVLVVLTLLASSFGAWFDRAAAALIGLYILINGFHILTQSLRSYAAARRGSAAPSDRVYEDILFSLLKRLFARFVPAFSEHLRRLPGVTGSPQILRRRAGLWLVGFVALVAGSVYASSGLYTLQPGEQAIVERFGRPLQHDSPLGPGLHYRWPWPIERLNKVDVEGIKRLTVGYTTGDTADIILWTNKHYLKEYSVITGEGPFLDVAMNVHYRVDHLYDYLFRNADPDATAEKLAYQVLREVLGTTLFFSSITTDRDALENRILADLQRRADELALGISIQTVCFRDVHPPTEVAASFEDVVSANEDYETYIEQARGYRRDLLPRARASAASSVNDALAYRNAVIAESRGKAQAFSLQRKVYSEAADLTQTRLVLEALEETLPGVRKYFVSPSSGAQRPDLWLDMPPLVEASKPPTAAREASPGTSPTDTQLQITDEGDMIDTFIGFQRRRSEDAQ